SRSASGKMIRNKITIAATLGHVERDRLPMVQNTRPCRASALATNCTSDTSALKEKTSAMPNSTRLAVLMAPQRATASSSMADIRANMKALAAMVHEAGTPGRDMSSTMASDAPKAAAEEI